jgi:hypothetical protein
VSSVFLKNKLDELTLKDLPIQLGKKRRGRRDGPFVKGPILVADLVLAARLGGKTLMVLLALHQRAGAFGQESITLPTKYLQDIEVSLSAKNRAIQRLEEAGLIKVRRGIGRASRVSLV